MRPMWESLPQEERVKLLSVDLQTLRERAKQVAEVQRQGACHACMPQCSRCAGSARSGIEHVLWG